MRGFYFYSSFNWVHFNSMHISLLDHCQSFMKDKSDKLPFIYSNTLPTNLQMWVPLYLVTKTSFLTKLRPPHFMTFVDEIN